ncbi:MAG: molybdenum cofactor biosynthesis protein MoaE [Acidobacteriota bacterium]
MTIQVLLFGSCREAAGTGELSLEVGSTANVSRAFAEVARLFPSLISFQKSVLFAVNEEHVRGDHEIRDGDTLAIFPPVSGGDELEDFFEITREPIDKVGLERRLLGGEAGAIVTFDGVVRNQTNGRGVVKLQYEAYVPMALKEMQRLGVEIHERWPDVSRVGIVHRFGELKVSESSVVIVVTSPHRGVAFEACRFAIDQLKQTVPIWKTEVLEDFGF